MTAAESAALGRERQQSARGHPVHVEACLVLADKASARRSVHLHTGRPGAALPAGSAGADVCQHLACTGAGLHAQVISWAASRLHGLPSGISCMPALQAAPAGPHKQEASPLLSHL